MKYLDNINQELFKIKELIEQKKYKEAVFSCNNIKKELINNFFNNVETKKTEMLSKKGENYKNEVLNIINNTNYILRKYDYDFQDVFEKNDAEKMYFSVIKLIDIYNEQIS